MRVLGVIQAGGRSVRSGSPKALVDVGGVRIIDRVRRALEAVAPETVLITNSPDAFESVGLEMRADIEPGLGALGGIYTGVLWARELQRDGILTVACDMPFASAQLLAHIADTAARDPERSDVVAPESTGPRALEPMFAYYSTRCIPAIERQISREDRRVIGFYADVNVLRIPLAEVARFGSPDVLFMNVNTPEDRDRASTIAQSSEVLQ
jgi:molybdopterin-guanine dinucleotide biosynthesis protein A